MILIISQHSIYKCTKSNIWFAGSLRSILQYLNSLWIQQYKLRFQVDQTLFLPIVVNEQEIESIVIKKVNLNVFIKFGIVELLDVFSLLGGPTNLDFFCKPYKTIKTSQFFPIVGSTTPTNWILQNVLQMRPLTINNETTTLLKKSIKTMKIWSSAECRGKLPRLNWNSLKYRLLVLKTMVCSRKIGKGKNAEFPRLVALVPGSVPMEK